MNAMHLVWQHPPATGNTLVQYGTQCIHARGRAVHRGHIPTGALSCSETENQIQTDLKKIIHSKIKPMKREPLFVALNNRKGSMGKSTFTILITSYLNYLNGYNVLVVVIIHSTASVPYGTRKWETLKGTCISGVCCADSSTGRARRCILSLPVFRARNWKRHFP